MQAPILLGWPNSLIQDLLDSSIRNFGLTTCLRVVWRGNPMLDIVLFKQRLNGPIAKVEASIAYEHPRHAKSGKDVNLDKICNHSRIVSTGGFGFHPFRHIING
ncbi:hypothetical protein ACFX2G_020568 [Malus domestica]